MLRSLFVTVLCVLAVVPAGADDAHAKLERKKTEMNEQSADQVSKIRFRDLVRTNLYYKGIPGADKFTVEFGERSFLYEVEKATVLRPEDVRPLDPVAPLSLQQSYLTLMTCVPMGVGTNRLLVQARLIL